MHDSFDTAPRLAEYVPMGQILQTLLDKAAKLPASANVPRGHGTHWSALDAPVELDEK